MAKGRGAIEETKGRSFATFLWLLKLGAPLNLWLLWQTSVLPPAPSVVLAQIFFVVSAYRCLFPVRYEGNVVFHDNAFSSIFVTRLLATFSEVAYIALFAGALRALNAGHAAWIDALSWLMVAQVVVSQGLVWGAVLTGRLALYFYEEVGWLVIFAANTIASAGLWRLELPAEQALLPMWSLLFGVLYLPWQVLHLRSLRANAAKQRSGAPPAAGLERALKTRNRRTDAAAWGGLIGVSWMTGYWAVLIPPWVYAVMRVLVA